MNSIEKARFDALYGKHLRALKLQGKSGKTIDAYARAVRRLAAYFDCVPDQLTVEQLSQYFAALVDSHSWSTVKVDRNGLQFFWRHVLERDWQWLGIVKPPQFRTLPDVLTLGEVEQLIAAARKLRYRVFALTTYSMGLRLSETLALQVGDIDAARQRVHIRRGKGHKARFVPLPRLTHRALQALWARHRHPLWLFPNPEGPLARVRHARTHMHRGSAQGAIKAMVTECGIKKRSPPTPCVTALPPICSSTA
jgi:integrase/recombinase XerD